MNIILDENNYILDYSPDNYYCSSGITLDENAAQTLLNYITTKDGSSGKRKLKYIKYDSNSNTFEFEEDRYNKDTEELIKLVKAAELRAKYIPSKMDSMEAAIQLFIPFMMTASIDDSSDKDNTFVLKVSGLFKDWYSGKHNVGDLCNANGQTWECYQEHDNDVYPDINPGNPAWFTFWKPIHASTADTARPFVPVQGAHDMYRGGQYCVYGEQEAVYRCIHDTNFSPTEYPAAWEVVNNG